MERFWFFERLGGSKFVRCYFVLGRGRSSSKFVGVELLSYNIEFFLVISRGFFIILYCRLCFEFG